LLVVPERPRQFPMLGEAADSERANRYFEYQDQRLASEDRRIPYLDLRFDFEDQ
jgi:hypothetical protein